MKKAGWITTAAVAAVAVVGGGTALALSTAETDPAEMPAAVETTEPAPSESAEPTPETSEATNPAASVSPAPEPSETSPYSDQEWAYIQAVQREIAIDELYPTDAETLSYGVYACEQFAAGVDRNLIVPMPDAPPVPNNFVRDMAREMLCPA